MVSANLQLGSGFRSLIGPRRRVIDSYLVPRVGDVKLRLDHIGIKVRSLIKRMRIVYFYVNDVVAFGDPRNVDPLPAELLEIPVCPSRRNPLRSADVSMALIRIEVLQQILQTKGLLVALGRYRAVQIQELIVRKSEDVIMHVTRRKNEILKVGITCILRVTNHEITVSTIDQHR